MPFPIHLTAEKSKATGITLALAAGILATLTLLDLLSPALLRLFLVVLWTLAAAQALPRPHRPRLIRGLLLALFLLGLALLLDPVIAEYLGRTPAPPAAAPALRGDAALLNNHLAAGRAELLEFLTAAGRHLWPAPATLLLGLLIAGALLAAWPRLERLLLRRAANPGLIRRAWLLRELPRRLGGWIRGESLRSLTMGVLWAVGTWLLGFTDPLAAGLLMALASWTPLWGLLFAAGLTLFFAADVRHLPLQAGGALIVFAVAWLASHLLFAPRLDAARPPLPRGALLLCALCGYALTGLGGFLLAAPLLMAAFHIKKALYLPA